MPKPPKPDATRSERTRKNMDMGAAKLSAAQNVLGARTETETVNMALDYVPFQDEVLTALDHLAARSPGAPLALRRA